MTTSEITTLVIVCVILFLVNILFVWWSSGIMCRNLGFESRANCILVGIFLPFFYWPLFLVSFIVSLNNNSIREIKKNEVKKVKKVKKSKK